MPSVIKKVMAAGIGGALAYYIVDAVLDEIITGTSAAENIIGSILPLVIAAGTIWLVISYAFNE